MEHSVNDYIQHGVETDFGANHGRGRLSHRLTLKYNPYKKEFQLVAHYYLLKKDKVVLRGNKLETLLPKVVTYANKSLGRPDYDINSEIVVP